ncbi:3'-5' exonuclease [Gloeobacter violaceus]|uniref:DNA 3'-5' helicase n=1 Tax=Gloeobacter violaceus (strain ATCC 29082 / PCC 7421) TaxID=251221 RepID=Q7NH00_GLOVI|nr:3'-5' exonuclease [Gloeobacter violaceus]BAC90678.1 gll2737 [Gloeobacter violaceus PCC 7421]
MPATLWETSFTETFLNELLNVPQTIQDRVKRTIKLLKRDPVSAKGNIKRLKDFKNNVYRIRLGDYRLIYSFGSGWIKLLSIRKRDESTYELGLPEFEVPGAPPDPALLEPQATDEPVLVPVYIPEEPESLPQTVTRENRVTTSLPFELTPELLKQWQIPEEDWSEVLAVRTSEQILDLPLPNNLISRLLDNLYPRPIEEIAVQPEFVLQQPEDLERFVEGDLIAFLLKLDPEQEKLRDFGSSGPILVKGGPGTGKSTLALYRVKKLLDAGHSPVLFTTYTNALVNYSAQLLEQLLGQNAATAGAEVSTIDRMAYQYFSQTYGKPHIVEDNEAVVLLEEALKTTAIPATNAFDRGVRLEVLKRLGVPYLLSEIRTIIEAWELTTPEQYLEIERRGRGTPLKANIREAIWAVYQTWSQLLAQKKLITWEQLHSRARDLVESLPQPPYQAVVVDEAQDLPPVKLRFMMSLATSPGGVYLTADASQSLYHRGFSWKQVHADLKVAGRTLLLKRNYRNTEEIAGACIAILQNSEAGDEECLYQHPSPHRGDAPTILLSDDFEGQVSAIREFLIAAAQKFRLPLHGSAVLCPSNHMGMAIAKQLDSLDLNAKFVSRREIDIRKPYIKVMTLHSAKGLEFPFVVVAGFDEGNIPYLDAYIPPDEVPTVLDEQRRLFYVGCSRAMRALMVCGSRSTPSRFLDSLVAPYWCRQELL